MMLETDNTIEKNCAIGQRQNSLTLLTGFANPNATGLFLANKRGLWYVQELLKC